MADLLFWLGQYFDAEAYLFWTRVQCIAWTAADVVIVATLLLIANRVRASLGKHPHVYSFAVLGFTLLPAPFVVVAPTGRLIFLIELAVTVPHFLLILFVMIVNARNFQTVAQTMLAAPESKSS